MQREIKFRYVVEYSGGIQLFFLTLDDIQKRTGEWFMLDKFCTEHLDHRIIARDQFTGLFDKNGNEIYEGDIIEYNNKGKYVKGVVSFVRQASAYWIQWEYKGGHFYKEMNPTFSEGEVYRVDHFEIMGTQNF